MQFFRLLKKLKKLKFPSQNTAKNAKTKKNWFPFIFRRLINCEKKSHTSSLWLERNKKLYWLCKRSSLAPIPLDHTTHPPKKTVLFWCKMHVIVCYCCRRYKFKFSYIWKTSIFISLFFRLPGTQRKNWNWKKIA